MLGELTLMFHTSCGFLEKETVNDLEREREKEREPHIHQHQLTPEFTTWTVTARQGLRLSLANYCVSFLGGLIENCVFFFIPLASSQGLTGAIVIND